jgi:hypothetical protein
MSICQYKNVSYLNIDANNNAHTYIYIYTHVYIYMVEVIVTSKGQSSINDLANQPAAEAFPSEK